MSRRCSPATSRPYGLERVCRLGGFARSSYYSGKARDGEAEGRSENPREERRGPVPPLSNDTLLDLIRQDLAASPFQGEGHRKVWARLRLGQGLIVGKNRILRVMRENQLLSPHRQGRPPTEHDGRITTDRPGDIWATDGTRVLTVDHGLVWVFAAVEHWNAECVGIHVCKRGDRFAALEPIKSALHSLYGRVAPGVARGLSLRTDHGCQYTSDDFTTQIRSWGISHSPGFVAEPQTNGVAERFFRTLKEQAIYGRTFRNLEEVREAVATFVKHYNHSWLIEKNGYLSPFGARQAWSERQAA